MKQKSVIFLVLLCMLLLCSCKTSNYSNTDSSFSKITDAETFAVELSPTPITAPTKDSAPTAAPERVYIGNKNTKKFHHPNCRSLPAEENRVYLNSRTEAENNSYIPCKLCRP